MEPSQTEQTSAPRSAPEHPLEISHEGLHPCPADSNAHGVPTVSPVGRSRVNCLPSEGLRAERQRGHVEPTASKEKWQRTVEGGEKGTPRLFQC